TTVSTTADERRRHDEGIVMAKAVLILHVDVHLLDERNALTMEQHTLRLGAVDGPEAVCGTIRRDDVIAPVNLHTLVENVVQRSRTLSKMQPRLMRLRATREGIRKLRPLIELSPGNKDPHVWELTQSPPDSRLEHGNAATIVGNVGNVPSN